MEEGGEWVPPARWGKTAEEGAEGSRDPPQTMISNQDPSPTAPSASPLQPWAAASAENQQTQCSSTTGTCPGWDRAKRSQ